MSRSRNYYVVHFRAKGGPWGFRFADSLAEAERLVARYELDGCETDHWEL